jgi:hypothetical protein
MANQVRDAFQPPSLSTENMTETRADVTESYQRHDYNKIETRYWRIADLTRDARHAAAPAPRCRHAISGRRQLIAGGELCHRHGGDTPPCVGHCSMQIRKEPPGLAHVTAARPGATRVMPRQNVEQGVALFRFQTAIGAASA